MATKKYTIKTANGTKDIETISFLGTLRNENANNIIAFSDQIYDKDEGQTVKEQIAAAQSAADKGITEILSYNNKLYLLGKDNGTDGVKQSDSSNNPTLVTVAKDASLQLTYGTTISGYQSADATIASVSTDGLITAIAEGATTITAVDASGNAYSTVVLVTSKEYIGTLDNSAGVTAAEKAQSTADSAKSTADANATKISNLQSSISGIKQFDYVIADHLPEASASTMYKIYLIPTGTTVSPESAVTTQEPRATGTGSPDVYANDVKDEYITIQDNGTYKWEMLGTTNLNLTDYAKTAEVNEALADYAKTAEVNEALAKKQDALKYYDESDINAVLLGKKTDDGTPTVYLGEATDGNQIAKKSEVEAKQDALNYYTEDTDSQTAKVCAKNVDIRTGGNELLYLSTEKAYYGGHTSTDNELAVKGDIPTTEEIQAITVNNATSATQDGNGNVIANTYLTATAISGKTYDETSVTTALA